MSLKAERYWCSSFAGIFSGARPHGVGGEAKEWYYLLVFFLWITISEQEALGKFTLRARIVGRKRQMSGCFDKFDFVGAIMLFYFEKKIACRRCSVSEQRMEFCWVFFFGIFVLLKIYSESLLLCCIYGGC